MLSKNLISYPNNVITDTAYAEKMHNKNMKKTINMNELTKIHRNFNNPSHPCKQPEYIPPHERNIIDHLDDNLVVYQIDIGNNELRPTKNGTILWNDEIKTKLY